MHKLLSLIRIQLKSGMLNTTDATTKTWKKVLLYLVVLICLLPLLGMLFAGFYFGFDFLGKLGQPGYLVNLAMMGTSFVIFLFSIFTIPSVYYFSRDIDRLLVLPLTPQQIIASKFVVNVIYEYGFTAMFMVPMYITMVMQLGFHPLGLIAFLIIFLTAPIYPLVLSSLLTMIIMRFVPFFNNRDRFNLIGGILAVVLAFGLSFWLNSMNTADMEAMFMSLLSGDNALMRVGTALFPFIPAASAAIFSGDLLQLLLYLGIILIALAVFLLCARFLYFKGAIGGSETAAGNRKITASDLRGQRHGLFATFLLKEMRMLFRTPVYFMNCVLTALIMPVLMVIIIFTSFSEIGTQITLPIDIGFLPDLWAIALLVAFAAGGFMGGINMIASTSVSREGTNAFFMKYIPVPIQTQVLAKAGCGILISAVCTWLMLIPLHLIIAYPLWLDLLFILGSFLSIVMTNLFGVLIDLIRPKLVWEQEASAVKQNLNGFLSMMLSFVLAIVFAAPIILWPEAMPLLCIALLIIQLILTAVLYLCMKKAGARLLRQI